MSVIGSNILAGASGQGGGYNLTRSLRFRSSASAYLNRTPASAGNRRTWTWSGWVKTALKANQVGLLTADVGAGSSDFFYLGDNIVFYFNDASSAYITTSAVYRDPSAWYHIILAVDTTQATASNRVKIYVNGVQVTSFGSASYPAQNYQGQINNNSAQNIGRRIDNAGYFDGYLTEINFIDGQALTPSSFGEYSATTGVWQPKKYAGTYGTNGFYLPFTDNSALTTSSNVGLGKDFSGNGNYWTTNNISITSGATYDSMTDVPTLTSATASNYCVMNPLDSASPIKPEFANLRLRNANNTHSITRGTVGVTSGKYYWEIKVSSAMNNFYSGIATNQTDINTTSTVGADAFSYAYVASNGEKRYNGTSTAYGSVLVNGDVLGCALDLDNGKIWWSVNGTFQASGDPAAGTNPAFTGVTGTCFPAGGTYNMTIDYNFGQRPFAYTPPTGFVALNTFNLPTPSIGATASTQANKYFDAILYTGANPNAAQTVTGLNFQPDFLWIKSRTTGYGHALQDAVRGATSRLQSDTTGAESTSATYVTSFNSNGFSLGTDYGQNAPNDAFVAWAWDANGTGVTNTAGSITSTVSANTSAGFSIVTYTGNGTAGATVGHGLGIAPRMIIVKAREDIGSNWNSYHASLGATQFVALNTTGAAVTSINGFNNTSPTSSVFSLGAGAGLNGNGNFFVAYCFSEVAGYSKFGSYTGNGSTDGTFVYTGFRPRWIMVKAYSSAGSAWEIIDTARDTYNITNDSLRANSSAAEVNGTYPDILSNGFKARSAEGYFNDSGVSYIYMAFAENPFKYSLAR